MDNFSLDITSEGAGKLKTAFTLLEHDTVTGYRVDAKAGMILYWTDSNVPGYSKFPFEMTAEQAAEFAYLWLQQADYGREPDHDGSNGRGWRLYNEDWGHVCGEWQAMIAVQPAWAMYGK